jgi:hypothetical protein
MNAGLFLDGLLGDERRKTGLMRAEAAGDPGPWRQQACCDAESILGVQECNPPTGGHIGTMDRFDEAHPQIEATYRIISLRTDTFGVEVAFPCSHSTMVTGFRTRQGAEEWVDTRADPGDQRTHWRTDGYDRGTGGPWSRDCRRSGAGVFADRARGDAAAPRRA